MMFFACFSEHGLADSMSMKSAHPEEPLSVSSFLRFIEETKTEEVAGGNNSDFLFRGQCIDEPLLPRIARLNPKGMLHNIEGLIMDDFKRQSPPFTEFEPKSPWDWLALAQHHGLPTRLLDWSYHPTDIWHYASS